MSDFDELIDKVVDAEIEFFDEHDHRSFIVDRLKKNCGFARTALTDAISAVTAERDKAQKERDDNYAKFLEEGRKFQDAVDGIVKLKVERDALKGQLGRAIGDKDTYCAYCGQAYSLDDPESPRKVGDHIAICSKHPMRKVEQERDKLKAKLAEANEDAERLARKLQDYADHDDSAQLENGGTFSEPYKYIDEVITLHRARVAKDES